ncbi:MAG: NUDIX domain-containing protein, partial [Dermatophilaceae bacterium]
VGGHVEDRESPREAVIRECFEELGVHVHDPVPIAMTSTDLTLEVHAFLVTEWEGEPANSAPDEHDDLRWFSPSELAGLKLADPAALSSIVRAVQVATDQSPRTGQCQASSSSQ